MENLSSLRYHHFSCFAIFFSNKSLIYFWIDKDKIWFPRTLTVILSEEV